MKKTTEERVEQTVCDCCSTIPLSYLSLDLDTPFGGWKDLFASRGVEVVTDDIGRPAIPRAALGELIAEREAAKAAQRAEDERRREAAAQQKKVAAGVPGLEGKSPVESMLSQDPAFSTPKDDFGPGWGSPTRELLDAELLKGQQETARRRAENAEKKRLRDQMRKDLQ